MFRCPIFHDTKSQSQLKSITVQSTVWLSSLKDIERFGCGWHATIIFPKKIERLSQAYCANAGCAWLLGTHWIRILCKIHKCFMCFALPSNGHFFKLQCSLFWFPELHFRKVQTQRHVPMVSVVKRHVEAQGVGRVGPGQRSFEFKHDAAYSLRYCCVLAHLWFSEHSCSWKLHLWWTSWVSMYQISTRRW